MLTSDIFTSSTDRDVLSVSQLNRKAKQLLETHLPLLWVEGELSNVSQPSSGHWYFTLKDEQAQVRCAMFRNRNMLVRFAPRQGQQVLIRARVSLYEGRGDYQLIVEHMEEAGFGALQRAFEALKLKLANEGLFDDAYKQPLPSLPKHIAVITSPTGAAIRDVLSVLNRRFPAIPVTVIPVAVQGKEAAPQIVRAIDLANRAGLFDVVILARGGGSLEDLWPFNEESVARAIHASELPYVRLRPPPRLNYWFPMPKTGWKPLPVMKSSCRKPLNVSCNHSNNGWNGYALACATPANGFSSKPSDLMDWSYVWCAPWIISCCAAIRA